MTNFEKYREQLLNFISTHGVAPAREDGEFARCGDTNCTECDFRDENCAVKFIKWLYEDDGTGCLPDAGKPKADLKGCNSCKYRDKTPDEDPCSECSRCYIDKFKPKPKKTRQSEFLKVYPNANVSGIQPCSIDKENSGEYCSKYDWCSECVNDYWSQEVE